MKKVKLSQETIISCPARDKSLTEPKSEDEVRLVQVKVSKLDVPLKNPMEVTLVLERVFDFCSFETLKNCRLVSTHWRDDSLKHWRNKAVLWCITDDDDDTFDFKEYLQLLETDEADDNDEAEFRNLKKYPFKRFCFLFGDHLNEYSNDEIQPLASVATSVRLFFRQSLGHECKLHELKGFLGRFPSLDNLHFEVSFHQEYNADMEGVSDFKLPTIKRIQIDQTSNTYSEVGAWEHVLKWFPNLEHLCIQYEDICESEGLHNLNSILGFIKSVRESSGGKNIISLRELELYSIPEPEVTEPSLTKEIIENIKGCNFPLERLTINFGWDTIYQLLESLKDILQFQKISFPFNTRTFDDLLRRLKGTSTITMEQLKEASLGNGHHRALCLLTRLELPNLEKLTIEENESEKEIIAGNYPVRFPRGRIYKSLEALEFLDTQTTPCGNTIETFAKMMPNLLNLTIPLDKKTFKIVCHRLRGLKTLKILSAQLRHEELDDEALTGVVVGVSKEKGEGAPAIRPPNITDLAFLTDLEISCDSQLLGNDVKFTDHAVVHGFLQLPRLYTLSIAFKNLSADVEAKLRSHLKGNLHIQEVPTDVDKCDVEIDGDDDKKCESETGPDKEGKDVIVSLLEEVMI